MRARVAQWIAGGEIYEVEFKGELRERLNDRDLVEAVVCLANGTGGVLLVGVEDDGTAIGVRQRPDSDAAPVACASARMRRRPWDLSSASDGSSDRCPVTAVLAVLKR